MKSSFFFRLTWLAILITAGTLSAKTVDMGFKVGWIVAAELTTAPVEIINREKSPYPNNYAQPSYAAVVVKMAPRRSLSSLDYSLTINGITANCIAAARNQDPFVSDPTVLYPEQNDVVRLLFVFDGRRVKGGSQPLSATLRSNLSGRSNVAIKVTCIQNKAFTNPANIPPAGLLQ